MSLQQFLSLSKVPQNWSENLGFFKILLRIGTF